MLSTVLKYLRVNNIHVHQRTLSIQSTKHDAVAIQYLLMVMDAPYQAVLTCVKLTTPPPTVT